VLEEFYKTIKYTAVSSKTGEGFQELLNLCKTISEDYLNEKEKSA
jgi:translation initiation factor IF-2